MTVNKKNPIDKAKSFKKIGLIILLIFGTLTIVSACTLLFSLFFSGKSDGSKLSTDLTDFLVLYNDDQSMRDLPKGFEITASNCTISSDKNTYSFTFTLKNIAPSDRNLSIQVYYNEDYIETYGSRTINPLIKVTKEDGGSISANSDKSFTVSGVIVKKGENPLETFKEKFGNVYVEIISGIRIGRLSVPVKFN